MNSVITYHELMHHINKKMSHLHLMSVKIVLAKTYEKVEWSLLETILTLHSFPLLYTC